MMELFLKHGTNKLFVKQINEGEKTIIFLHGNSQDGRMWNHQVESKKFTGYRLVVVDLPGHGKSETYYEYTREVLFSVVETVVNHFNLKNYYVCGHSFGSNVILQNLHILSGCKGLVILNSPPATKPMNATSLLPNPAINVLYTENVGEQEIEMLASAQFHLPKNTPDFFVESFRNSDGKVRTSILQLILSGNYTDELEILNTTSIPVLMISGKDEKMVNNDSMCEIKFPTMWKSKIFLVENSSHCPHWENPDEINSLIIQFLEDINKKNS